MKQYRVVLLIRGGKKTEIILGGANLSDVLSTAKSMYPHDKVLKAYPV